MPSLASLGLAFAAERRYVSQTRSDPPVTVRIEFSLPQEMIPIGVAAETAAGGGLCEVITTEGLTSHDGALLTWRLETLNESILRHIPGLPPASLLDNLLVVVRPDLSGVAYVNELRVRASVRATRAVTAGAPVLIDDIDDIATLDVGIEVPPDCGVVLIRSFGWRKSLFYDLQPLSPTSSPRSFGLERAFARQALQLMKRSFAAPGVPALPPPRLPSMGEGIAGLSRLLLQRSEDEASYQELFAAHPWMFGGAYREIVRHQHFDDANIPDFTAIRHHDSCHDIIELKQPFLSLFRQDGEFAASFNDAWNQAERYLAFARRQRDYLRTEKGLTFDNPRCLLILGHKLDDRRLRLIREKESMNPAISVLTYDQVATWAQAIIDLATEVGRAGSTSENAG